MDVHTMSGGGFNLSRFSFFCSSNFHHLLHLLGENSPCSCHVRHSGSAACQRYSLGRGVLGLAVNGVEEAQGTVPSSGLPAANRN